MLIQGRSSINTCVKSGADSQFVTLGEGGEVNYQHGKDQQSACHCPCELLSANHCSWRGGG